MLQGKTNGFFAVQRLTSGHEEAPIEHSRIVWRVIYSKRQVVLYLGTFGT